MNHGAPQIQMPDASGLTMEQKVAALKEILTRHGAQVLDEPQRFENLLLDTTFSPAERAVLQDAAKLRIPERILAQPNGPIPAELLARCIDQLAESMALRRDAASEAVEVWIRALGRELPSRPAPAAASPAPPRGLHRLNLHYPRWLSGRWLPQIQTREQALAIIRTSLVIFLGVAAFDVLLSIWEDSSLLAMAAIYLIGGFALYRFNSRIAAVGLLGFSGLIFVLGCIAILIAIASRQLPELLPTEIWVSIAFATWAGLRATAATFRLHHPDQ